MDSKGRTISEADLKELAEIGQKITALLTWQKKILDACGTAASTPSASAAPAASEPPPAAAAGPAPTVADKPSAPEKSPDGHPPMAGGRRKRREVIVDIIKAAETPPTFDEIYKALEDQGALPSNKPMLVVRKILFDTKVFSVAKGRYSLVD